MKIFPGLCAAALLLSVAAALPAQKPAIAHTSLKVGDKAPDFTMKSTDWKDVKLSDFRGKKSVVLAFYVLAFTGG
jgi:peroxiredoxin